MTEREMLNETAQIRQEIRQLKHRLQSVRDTYREIEAITAQLRQHIVS